MSSYGLLTWADRGKAVIIEIVQWVVRALLAIAFIGMGINHLRPRAARVMAKMIPPALHCGSPLTPAVLVLVTGLLEIAGGLGLVIPPTSFAAAICLAVFLVVVFPANVYAAAHPETFRSLAIPLIPRLIAQIALIALVLFAGWPL